MFVRESRYNRLLTQYYDISHKYKMLLSEWNALVSKINKKGGDDFLKHATIGGESRFTDDELRSLRALIHPDRHDNKPVSHELTAKVNKLLGGRAMNPK
jgi:hypothetical protein